MNKIYIDIVLSLFLLCTSLTVHAKPVQIRINEGHADQVLSLTGSEQLNILLTGGNDNKIVVWDRVSLREVKSINLTGTPTKILPTQDRYTFLIALSDWSVAKINIQDNSVRPCHTKKDWLGIELFDQNQAVLVKKNGAVGTLDINCDYKEIFPGRNSERPKAASLFENKLVLLFENTIEKLDINRKEIVGKYNIPSEEKYNYIGLLSDDILLLGHDENSSAFILDHFLPPKLRHYSISKIETNVLKTKFTERVQGHVAGATLSKDGNILFIGLMGGICGTSLHKTDSTFYKLALCDIQNRKLIKSIRSDVVLRGNREARDRDSVNNYFLGYGKIYVAGYRGFSIFDDLTFSAVQPHIFSSSFVGFARVENETLLLSGKNLYAFTQESNKSLSLNKLIISKKEILSACYQKSDLIYAYGNVLYKSPGNKKLVEASSSALTSLQCAPNGLYFSDELGGVYYFDTVLSTLKVLKKSHLDEFNGKFITTALVDSNTFLSWTDYDQMGGMGVLSRNLTNSGVRREFNLKNNPERHKGVVSTFAEDPANPGNIVVALHDENSKRSHLYSGFMNAGFDKKGTTYRPKFELTVDGRIHSICSHPSGKIFLASDSGLYVIQNDRPANRNDVNDSLQEGVFTTVNCLKDKIVVTNTSGALVFKDLQGKTLYSYYVGDDGEWILQIPDGYFTYSHQSMLEHISVVSGLNSNSISQLYDVFYRPDIVRAKLSDEDIRPLIGDMTIEKALRNPPPRVEIASLPSATSASRIKIPYAITPDSGGVAEVRAFHNGKLISSDGIYKDAPGRAYAPVAGKSVDAARFAEANLLRNAKATEAGSKGVGNQAGGLRDQLIVRGAMEKKCTPGKIGDPCKGEIEVEVLSGEENTITVVAFNRDNTVESVPAVVSFESSLPKEEPHLWVIGVGINQFSSISPLKNARKDAQDFVCAYAGKDSVSKFGVVCNEVGKAKSLFKPQNIHLVNALFDSQATRASILASLDKVAQQAKPGDTFVWFVASHGMMDANSNFGIIAYDTQCLNRNCTDIAGHLTSNDILDASKKIKAMKQLVVLDTCHSGGLDSKLSGLYDARVSSLAKNMGLHLYASAQATEAAEDGKPGTNGTFTAQLLDGINGAAPSNSAEEISVMTLGQYARKKTIDATRSKTGAKDAKPGQTPVIQHFGQDTGLVRLR